MRRDETKQAPEQAVSETNVFRILPAQALIELELEPPRFPAVRIADVLDEYAASSMDAPEFMRKVANQERSLSLTEGTSCSKADPPAAPAKPDYTSAPPAKPDDAPALPAKPDDAPAPPAKPDDAPLPPATRPRTPTASLPGTSQDETTSTIVRTTSVDEDILPDSRIRQVSSPAILE